MCGEQLEYWAGKHILHQLSCNLSLNQISEFWLILRRQTVESTPPDTAPGKY